jgi:predicted small secreted protein
LATPWQKEFIMRKYLAVTFASLVVIIGASTFLSACNTVEGAGKDVSKAGHEVSEEANEHK